MCRQRDAGTLTARSLVEAAAEGFRGLKAGKRQARMPKQRGLCAGKGQAAMMER